MSLLEKASIIYNSLKELKKSILQSYRTEAFLVIALLVFIITPLIFYAGYRIEAAANQVNIYVSPKLEELFGKKMTESLFQEFIDKNPDIRVRTANSAAAAAGEIDILIFEEGDFSPLAAAQMLLELNDFTNFDSGTRQLAVPLVSFMDMPFYNKDILTAAGFGSPPKTRDEYLNYARTVTRGEFDGLKEPNPSGAAMSLNSADRQALSRDIFTWIWASGGSFWPGGGKPSLNARAITADLTFLGTLFRENIITPGVFETTGDLRIEQFAQGKIALMIASTRAIPFIRSKMGDERFGITTVPDSGAGGRYNINITAIYAGINANSSNTEEAWRFMEFLAEKSSFLCAELNAVPGVVSNIIPGDYVRDDIFYSKAWDIFESAIIAESFSGRANAQRYEDIFMEELLVFFESARTPQQTVTAIQQRWDAID
ncbi:MAG: extracellular solute-binding protein [Treponema sp.]|nr:extracellular solute-binding protein [Treponema sp.]